MTLSRLLWLFHYLHISVNFLVSLPVYCLTYRGFKIQVCQDRGLLNLPDDWYFNCFWQKAGISVFSYFLLQSRQLFMRNKLPVLFFTISPNMQELLKWWNWGNEINPIFVNLCIFGNFLSKIFKCWELCIHSKVLA